MATHFADITIKASAKKVFDALTDPELVKLWQYGRLLTTNWEVGSEIKFRSDWEDKKPLEQWGTVLEIQANELVKYNLFTHRPDLEDTIENYAVTSYILTADNDQTQITLVQEDNRPSGFVGISLKPILVALKKMVEAQP